MQSSCLRCKTPLGFADQPAAYFNEGSAFCPRHIDIRLKSSIDAAQQRAHDNEKKEIKKAQATRFEWSEEFKRAVRKNA